MKAILIASIVAITSFASPSRADEGKAQLPQDSRFITCKSGDGLYQDRNKSLFMIKGDPRCEQ